MRKRYVIVYKERHMPGETGTEVFAIVKNAATMIYDTLETAEVVVEQMLKNKGRNDLVYSILPYYSL